MFSKVIIIVVTFLLIGFLIIGNQKNSQNVTEKLTDVVQENIDEVVSTVFPLSISALRNGTYEGDDHNLSSNFNTAMQRSVEFF